MPSPDADRVADWQNLYDEAPCGLMLTDLDGSIRLVNRTFCRWIGIEREALLAGRRFQDLLTMGGRVFHQTHWQPLLQMQGSVSEVKLDLVHGDGHAIPMVMNAISRERDGAGTHEISLFVAKDRHTYERELMLARRRAELLLAQQVQAQRALTLAEARLRIAMESAHLYVWEVDPVTGECRYDDRVALLLGLDSIRPVGASDYFAAIEADDRGQVAGLFSRLTEATTELDRCSYRLNGVDGVQRTVMATARVVVEGGARPRQIVGLLHDITELSRQRAAAEDRAVFAEQMIGIVSHDLRNPLATIKLGATALELSAAANPAALLGIQRAVVRAQGLIDDLLDFTSARIGRGLDVALQDVDLHALLETQVAELAAAYPGRELIHRHSGPGDCAADPDRLYQLVGNLVSNAMAYGSAHGPVTVTSRIDGERIAIAVHNEGSPIPAASLPTLFLPMVRGERGSSASRSIGLGLYIVSEIARAHSGEVVVASTPSEGTTFTVGMPRRAPHSRQDIPSTQPRDLRS